jgi:succinate dehydrogenase / fumarate reductase cytochrome b subunit
VTVLQAAFAVVLSLLLLAVLLFAAFSVRAAFILRSSGAGGGWLVRLGRARDRDVQRWAFVAHRVTGAAIFAFLLLHVLDVALVAVSAPRFDEVHSLYGSAPMRVFECLLLFAILFHTFNGLRLLLLDLAELDLAAARRLLHVAIALTVVAGTVAGIVILRPEVT